MGHLADLAHKGREGRLALLILFDQIASQREIIQILDIDPKEENIVEHIGKDDQIRVIIGKVVVDNGKEDIVKFPDLIDIGKKFTSLLQSQDPTRLHPHFEIRNNEAEIPNVVLFGLDELLYYFLTAMDLFELLFQLYSDQIGADVLLD